MQIEGSFRDTKSERYGQSLSFTGSRCIKRLEILLLIGMLSQVAYLLIGKAAYIKSYFKQFQANTVRCVTAECFHIFIWVLKLQGIAALALRSKTYASRSQG